MPHTRAFGHTLTTMYFNLYIFYHVNPTLHVNPFIFVCFFCVMYEQVHMNFCTIFLPINNNNKFRPRSSGRPPPLSHNPPQILHHIQQIIFIHQSRHLRPALVQYHGAAKSTSRVYLSIKTDICESMCHKQELLGILYRSNRTHRDGHI